MKILQNGIGATLGSDLLLQAPVMHSGNIRFVSSVSGNDSNAGTDRKKPKATLQAALTASTNFDWVVLLEDHAETISAALTAPAHITILGEGRSDGRPTAELRFDSAADIMLSSITASYVEIYNVYFSGNEQATTVPLMNFAGPIRLVDCVFRVDQNNDAPAVFSTGRALIQNCEFFSDSDGTTPPAEALSCQGVNLRIENCVFDNGEHGFKNSYALLITGPGSTTALGFGLINTTFRNGADYSIEAGVEGFVAGVTADGSALGSW